MVQTKSTRDVDKKHLLGSRKHFSVLMDPNTRTGRQGGVMLGSERCRVLHTCGRETLNDYDERLINLRF